MKYLYSCEKCRKTFDDRDDAYACEESHKNPSEIYDYNGQKGFTQWKEGSPYPQTLCTVVKGRDEEGDVVLDYKFVTINVEATKELIKEQEEEKIREKEYTDRIKQELRDLGATEEKISSFSYNWDITQEIKRIKAEREEQEAIPNKLMSDEQIADCKEEEIEEGKKEDE